MGEHALEFDGSSFWVQRVLTQIQGKTFFVVHTCSPFFNKTDSHSKAFCLVQRQTFIRSEKKNFDRMKARLVCRVACVALLCMGALLTVCAVDVTAGDAYSSSMDATADKDDDRVSLADLMAYLFPPPSVSTLPAVTEYDYVVVGGGTSGCVVAARLSENPNVQVLLIEAGRDDSNSSWTGPVIMLGKPFVDIQSPLVIPYRSREAVSNGFSPNHYIPISRTLGGGSATNGQCYSRLGREDWDRWNISGWSYDEVAPFQARVENVTYDSDPSPSRGRSGPMQVRKFPAGDLSLNLMQSMSAILGLNITDSVDNGNARGISQFERNSKADSMTRESTWTAYLKPVYKSRKNLRIITDATVTGIIWERDGILSRRHPKLVAQGVRFTVNTPLSSRVMTALVRKELIISAGAINTPKLLMLSGVGPESHLISLGIKVLMKSEHVGRNLQDHFRVPTMSFVFAPPAVPDRVLPVAFGSTGVDPSDNSLDYEIAFVQAANTPTSTVVVAIPVVTRNSARGSVQLLDTNPTTLPIIDFGAFANPTMDFNKLVKIANATRMIARRTPGFLTEASPGLAAVPLSDSPSHWTAFMKTSASFGGAQSYAHFSSSCRIGKTIGDGVVDSMLLVHGSANLRIVDMSVLTGATSQRPFATAALIGERGAAFSKDAANFP